MANCPNCNKKLHIWNIKAECPACGKNIPNYNWEERLEEDARQREEAFFKMHTYLNKLKFNVVGNPMRILRLVFSFLPIVGYVVPLASVSFQTADGVTDIKNFSLLSLFLDKQVSIGAIFALLSDSTKQAGVWALTVLGLLAASLLFGVIAFFLVPFATRNLRSSVHAVFHAICIVLYALSPVMLPRFLEAYTATGLAQAAGTVGWGIYLGIALFAVAFVFDLINTLKPLGDKDGKYIPTDELQREYAVSIGAITPDEYPDKKKSERKKEKSKD